MKEEMYYFESSMERAVGEQEKDKLMAMRTEMETKIRTLYEEGETLHFELEEREQTFFKDEMEDQF